jgi:hypothetical protein
VEILQVLQVWAAPNEEDPMRTADGFTPMPETWHPSLPESTAGQLAAYLWKPSEDGKPAPIPRPLELVRLDEPLRAIYARDESEPVEVQTRTVLFSVGRCMAPAPFIGDATEVDVRYIWLVAQDEAGRWVAGPANLIWRDL